MSWVWGNSVLFAGSLFVGMLICLEIGYRIGRQRAARDPEGGRTGTDATLAAVFALTGLILAFSFANAGSRFDARRQLIVEETNAIGTAYLRLDLLPASYQAALRESFRRYLDTRLSAYEKLPDIRAAEAELAKAAALQNEIWAQAEEACNAEGRQSTTMLLLPALNEMIDITTTRTFWGRTHSPGVIYALLVGLALLGSMLAGNAMSANERRPLLHMIGFALAVAITIYVIVDLEFPRIGLIQLQTADRALIELRQMMK
jgi:hypothetical protein